MRGMTLIEVLAVVVIVSLAATITTVSLASANDEAVFRATISEIRDVDAQARFRARCGTPCLMAVRDDGLLVLFDLHRPDQLLAQSVARRDVSILLDSSPGSDRVVHFDRLGRSEDYSVGVRYRERVERWRVSGLTGWMAPEDQL